ncbi:hypothetical protein ACOTTU_17070 [Roseobacter sp. EG26]|uniref:hypothetical protein n=1 Tax=Roseobacter sp. EG26 TaxID=3412477 RepID=UPI003CE5A474
MTAEHELRDAASALSENSPLVLTRLLDYVDDHYADQSEITREAIACVAYTAYSKKKKISLSRNLIDGSRIDDEVVEQTKRTIAGDSDLKDYCEKAQKFLQKIQKDATQEVLGELTGIFVHKSRGIIKEELANGHKPKERSTIWLLTNFLLQSFAQTLQLAMGALLLLAAVKLFVAAVPFLDGVIQKQLGDILNELGFSGWLNGLDG